jgi:hypothetical protein
MKQFLLGSNPATQDRVGDGQNDAPIDIGTLLTGT